jgi:hypothetical protein
LENVHEWFYWKIYFSERWVGEFKNLYSDASGNAGFAAVFGSWWFAESWLASYLKEYQIAITELFPIVVA